MQRFEIGNHVIFRETNLECDMYGTIIEPSASFRGYWRIRTEHGDVYHIHPDNLVHAD